MIKKVFNHLHQDLLYRNSIYYMSSTFVLGGFGFIFWIIAAKFFNSYDIGIATALISVMALITSLSSLGLNIGLIKYLPQSERKNNLINSSLVVVTIATVIVSAGFLIGLNIFSPKLLFLRSNLFYISSFIIFMIFASLNTLLDSIFIAYRGAGNVLFKNTFLGIIKLLLPIGLVFLGAYGIFSSVALSTLIASLIGFIILSKKFSYTFNPKVNKEAVEKMGIFSAGNYIAGFLYQAPTLLLPIVILNRLGSNYAAYFYIVSMILNFLIIIPLATTQVLLAEGSYSEEGLSRHIKKATLAIFSLLTPAVIILFFFGNYILNIFGKEFAQESYRFLQIMSISIFFISIILIGNGILRIKHKIKLLIILNLFGACIILALSFLFLQKGLYGIGIGWLIGQAIISFLFLFSTRKAFKA